MITTAIEPGDDEDEIAPDGFIWKCPACGKTSKNRMGDPGSRWDVSCYVASILVPLEES